MIKKRVIKRWTEEDLIYLAGYLDGEGCFYIGEHHKIAISCSNTHKPTVEWLHRTFGGSFMQSHRQRKANHRLIYTWQVVSKDALAVCTSVAPYLKEKMGQAVLLIALQQTKKYAGGRVPFSVLRERDRLKTIFKGMKHVAW